MDVIKLILEILVICSGLYWAILDYYNKINYKNQFEEKKIYIW
jgi:hypothetical protein